MANHTATHLLHEALRTVLGDHVHQAGSQVRPDKLRFDFTHPQAMTAEERDSVERRVNEVVFENHAVRTYIVPKADAEKLGAMMLFGEKYGDEVRVVEVEGVSRELCGGTHVRTTAEIGPFVILSEGSVGSGARRIEAVTAGEAFALFRARAEKAEELRGELERARKEAKKPSKQAEADFEIRSRDGDVVVVEARGVTGGDLRDLSDRIRQQEGAAAVLLGSADDGRAFLVFNLDQALADKGVDAVDARPRRGEAHRRRGRRAADAGRGRREEAGGARRGAGRRRSAPSLRSSFEGARRSTTARRGRASPSPTRPGTLARPLCMVERAGDRGRARAAPRARPGERAPSASSSACR